MKRKVVVTPGQKVVCVNSGSFDNLGNAEGCLTQGREYTVQGDRDNDIFLEGVSSSWSKKRFELVKTTTNGFPRKILCIEDRQVGNSRLVKGVTYTALDCRVNDGAFSIAEDDGAWWNKMAFSLDITKDAPITSTLTTKIAATNSEHAATALETALIAEYGNHYLIIKNGESFEIHTKTCDRQFLAVEFAKGFLKALP